MVEAVDRSMHVADLLLDMTCRRPKEVAVNNEKFREGRLSIDAFTDCRSLWDSKQSSPVALEKNLMPD
eukprot:10275041-Heterocapsa_arctica.AAC.1